MSRVGLRETAHSWANTGVLLGARVRRRVAFETIKLFDANDINCHPNIGQINMQGASVLLLRRIECDGLHILMTVAI